MKETSTSTGTGTFTMAGAASGCRSFLSVLSTNQQCWYVIENPGDGTWECGLGTFDSGFPGILTRTTVTASSNSGSAVSFAAGTKYVWIDATAANLPAYKNSTYFPALITAGGRLTLSSGTPVTSTDQTDKTTIYYTPYLHNSINLWDGNRWYAMVFAETSISPSLTTATTKTGNSTNTSAALTGLSNTTSLYVGQPISSSGAGIPSNAIIKSIDSSSQVTMNVAATSSTSAVTFTFSHANYDLFAYCLTDETFNLEKLAWTDNTTRATAITYQDGRYCKSGDKTRLYLGSFRMTAGSSSGYVINDTKTQRYLWNMYNRVPRQLMKYESGSSSWTYTSATWRAINNNTANRVEFLTGLSEAPVTARGQFAAASSNGATGSVGINVDSTTATPSQPYIGAIGGNSVAYYLQALSIDYSDYPGLGYHYLQLMESGATTTIFFGGGFGAGGISGTIDC